MFHIQYSLVKVFCLQRIEDFLKLAFYMNGDTHEPNYLRVSWGDLNFSCRLSSVNINYTSFDRQGNALRAELDLQLISDEDVNKRLAIARENSWMKRLTNIQSIMEEALNNKRK